MPMTEWDHEKQCYQETIVTESESQSWVDVCVEEPLMSGTFAEVLTIDVTDAGHNILWSGTASEYVRVMPAFRVPTKLVARTLGKRDGCWSEVNANYYLPSE